MDFLIASRFLLGLNCRAVVGCCFTSRCLCSNVEPVIQKKTTINVHSAIPLTQVTAVAIVIIVTQAIQLRVQLLAE